MTYIVLENKNSTELIKSVNALLVAGWRLQGGVAFDAIHGYYLQALYINGVPDAAH